MSENIDKQYLISLEKLGLTEKEARVYLDMLRRVQPTGTSKIVRATGLHGQFVYDALAGLEEKGLATHVIVGKRKRFAATSPSRLELLAERKKTLATELAHDLELGRISHSQDFELYQGEDAFVAHEFEELGHAGEGEQWLILGGSEDKFVPLMGKAMKEYDELRLRKRIQIRYLGSESQRTELLAFSKARPLFEARVIAGFGPSIVNTLVRPHSLSLSTYADPVLTYAVRNDRVAESYRTLFEAIWSASTPFVV